MVDILLATYNGEKYLREQLDSLFAQTYQGFRILVRDDGSTDGTMHILREYALHHAGKIEIIHDNAGGGNPARNFIQLMKHSTAGYVMFCDQDDYWFPDKIQVMLQRMQVEEKRAADGAAPILVFSDYRVADSHLNPMPVNESHLQIARFYKSFNRLLVQNYVTGCATMINKTACQMAGDYDERILMHDWWVALYVSAMGRIVHIPMKLMYYRQHNNNDVGARDVKSMQYRIEKLKDRNVRNSKYSYYGQAELLKERYFSEMSADARKTLSDFLEIQNYPKLKRMKAAVDGGFLKSDVIRSLGYILYI
ncbi:MAG: glycosyltransferase family 2 protein [Eubacteriales bacterium]